MLLGAWPVIKGRATYLHSKTAWDGDVLQVNDQVQEKEHW